MAYLFIFNRAKKALLVITSIFLVLGCSLLPVEKHIAASKAVSINKVPSNLPNHWLAKDHNNSLFDDSTTWLTTFADPQLISYIDSALQHNFQLKQQALDVQLKKQQLLNAGSELWPDLSASLITSKRKNSTTEVISDNATLELSTRYELDLWGKLTAAEQKANVEWLAEQANYQQAKQQLLADVANAYFAAISAKQLQLLEQKRADNIKENLAIIEAGYKRGLNQALDVYLTRNEYNSALSLVAQKKQVYLQAIRNLQTFLANYPSGLLDIPDNLPSLTTRIAAGTPIDIIKRKPNIKASWYQLLASDAGLAVAHKQRFPSFSFSASLSASENNLKKLLSTGNLGWSLLSDISAPIFQAGRLKNNEQIAQLALQQTEQRYLDTVYQSLSEVENLLTAESITNERFALQQKAMENAKAAYQLSFSQYKQGLTIYTTVLDAQNRWYIAQSNVIQLQQQRLSNRINLFLALGGDFSKSTLITHPFNTNE
jgi:NodT family efflux transporter outer membrane factor (OMF) lipoprotein